MTNFTRLITAREITYNSFEIPLTTNHAITYTYNSCIIGHCHGNVYNTVWECGQILILSRLFWKHSLHWGKHLGPWTMATSFALFVYYNSCTIGKVVNCHANVIILFWECGQVLILQCITRDKNCCAAYKQNFHYTTMATNYFSQPPLREKL